ncbi:DUF2752 domain-containing protein [soil metagenome]
MVQRFWQAFKAPSNIYLLFAVFAAGLIFIYKNFDPAAYTEYFPKCPLLKFTGYQCPGCGSQRATHALLNLHVGKALALNPLFVIAIPYLLVGFIFERITLSEKLLRVRKALFGPLAIKVVLVIIMVFWIGRNINS